jgi:hypothetical protein
VGASWVQGSKIVLLFMASIWVTRDVLLRAMTSERLPRVWFESRTRPRVYVLTSGVSCECGAVPYLSYPCTPTPSWVCSVRDIGWRECEDCSPVLCKHAPTPCGSTIYWRSHRQRSTVLELMYAQMLSCYSLQVRVPQPNIDRVDFTS